ncbi:MULTISPECIES: hypothetical protein [Metabacillus]|uniref:Uncharacterized protein n=1 Tax=Metabacillus hrfriensis TaxID=3048891 RepID=A0ACD4R742_9BACI|nr:MULTISPECIES: hypothetical protein [Metabacillus]UAL54905.1 hypothetical protein K8L98_16235 [Metabacillus dongyingensis]USK27045.1 hypothetical protein LIT32_16330 [Bacillus sp. CMF21]WHZ56268.1 hypothetical protein QLQ22_16400 [Metabacillus sp. CT-WN-B3]
MGRGKDFNHKKKGHELTISKKGQPVAAKHSKDVEYAIEPAASKGERAVTFQEAREIDE